MGSVDGMALGYIHRLNSRYLGFFPPSLLGWMRTREIPGELSKGIPNYISRK